AERGSYMRSSDNNTIKDENSKPKSIKDVPKYLISILGDFFGHLFYIIKLVWETKPFILLAMFLFSLINGVIPVANSVVAANLLNTLAGVITGETTTFQPVIYLLIIQFVLIFVSGILTHIEGIVINVSGELVSNHIKTKIMSKSKNIDLSDFDRPAFYEKLENANREAQSRPIGILRSTFELISSIISTVIFIVVLSAVHPFASVIVFLLAIPGGIISFVYRRRNFRYIRGHSKERRQLNYYSGVMTDKNIVKEIKIFGLSEMFIDRYKKVFHDYFKGLKKLFVSEGVCSAGISLVSTAVNCVLFLYVAYGVFCGNLLIGDYSLYTGALNSVANGAARLVRIVVVIYEGTLFIDNLIDFINQKQSIVPKTENGISVQKGKPHTIEFKNVSFSYPGSDKKVLDNINITISGGESVVLVGLNGAGKTTLIKLITRLYDPTSGVILLDGRDIRDYDVKQLYSLFGIVFQDFGKYALSISENIKIGNIAKDDDNDDVISAAKMSSADDFIKKLPDGYDTPLTRIFEEGGTELSIGQWQKLSVARAFYGDNDILILDEPTASLDAIAEQEIFSKFDELRKGKTAIFVSHRLSSATTADKIIVIDGGCVAEVGNHRQLMDKQGAYYQLFSTQAQRYIQQD
ncbi:MAG: ABC transporter ATP-binding protein, partial [Clostridia bacterium]|nr:ABC transporter ATP-binding protein [Clostridia bacterium]